LPMRRHSRARGPVAHRTKPLTLSRRERGLVRALGTLGLLQRGIDYLFKLFIRDGTTEWVAIDDKARRAVDASVLPGLHISIDPVGIFTGIQTGRELLIIQFQLVRILFQIVNLQTRSGEELVVVGPEFLLFRRTLRGLSGFL